MAPANRSLLIRDALLIPGDSPPFVGWLRVEGNRIAALAPGTAPDVPVGQIIDGRERALIPGFVNTHAHSHSTLTRGSAEGLPLAAWLQTIEREQSRLTDEQAYYGALATYCEALLAGTTSLMDMCLRPQAALQAAEAIGLRAHVVPYVADSKPFTPTLAQVEPLLAAAPRQNDRLHVWCGLHDLESCSEAQIRHAVELAQHYHVGIHLHCAETQALVSKTIQRTGKRSVVQLSELGVLGPQTVLAHCVWIDDEEQVILADAGSHVAHCPHANLKLGSGVAPVPAMVDKGVNVGLATDGAKANNNLDMFDVMKFASLLPKGVHCNPTLLPSETIFAMATRGGAEALGLNSGVLAPGMLADLTLIRLDRFHLQPATPETIVTNLVHAARGADVDLVIVDGQIVVENGRVQTIDQEDVRTTARSIALTLLQAE